MSGFHVLFGLVAQLTFIALLGGNTRCRFLAAICMNNRLPRHHFLFVILTFAPPMLLHQLPLFTILHIKLLQNLSDQLIV